MITFILIAILVVVPTIALIMEWVVTPGISESHHSDRDVYVIPHKMTQVPAGISLAAGVPGVVLGVLRIIDLFDMRAAPVLSFFASFVLAAFVMWMTMRRYQVTAYADRLCVRPFIGRTRTVRYDEIDQLLWSDVKTLTNTRDLSVIVDNRIVTVLLGTIDLDQILLRIDRDDVIRWAR